MFIPSLLLVLPLARRAYNIRTGAIPSNHRYPRPLILAVVPRVFHPLLLFFFRLALTVLRLLTSSFPL